MGLSFICAGLKIPRARDNKNPDDKPAGITIVHGKVSLFLQASVRSYFFLLEFFLE